RDFHVTGVQTCALPICRLIQLSGAGGSLPRQLELRIQPRCLPEILGCLLEISSILRLERTPKSEQGFEVLRRCLTDPGRLRLGEIGRASCREKCWVRDA